MKFISLFSGIGGFDKGFEDAGLTCVAQVEKDKNCLKVLEAHWPNVQRFEDVKNVGAHNLPAVDLVCGGFPCQDLSVAGRRKGLVGERSGLWFEFHRIIEETRPRWVVIENVPGLLSSEGGRDFAVILRGLVECGYGVCWRILDSQYFGVAQRRRRVYVVASLGNGRCAQVLFEREGMSGDFTKGREEGKRVAPDTVGSLDSGGADREGSHGYAGMMSGAQQSVNAGHIISSLQARDYKGVGSQYVNEGKVVRATWWDGREVSDSLAASSNEQRMPDKGRLQAVVSGTISSKWAKGSGGPSGHEEGNLVTFNIQNNDGGGHKRKDRPDGGMYVNETDKALTVGSTDLTAIIGNNQWADPNGVSATVSSVWAKQKGGPSGDEAYHLTMDTRSGVRRLTPTECERLQAFPDGWTFGSDSVRYKQLGNAVTVSVIHWLGQRILEVESNL